MGNLVFTKAVLTLEISPHIEKSAYYILPCGKLRTIWPLFHTYSLQYLKTSNFLSCEPSLFQIQHPRISGGFSYGLIWDPFSICGLICKLSLLSACVQLLCPEPSTEIPRSSRVPSAADLLAPTPDMAPGAPEGCLPCQTTHYRHNLDWSATGCDDYFNLFMCWHLTFPSLL